MHDEQLALEHIDLAPDILLEFLIYSYYIGDKVVDNGA